MAERIINGTTYRVKAPLASRSLPLFFRLGKVLGPGFDTMISALLSRTAENDDAFGAKMLVAVADILGAADPNGATALIGEVVALAEVHRPSGDWDAASMDELDVGDLIPVTGFALETVFGPLVGSVVTLAGAARAT